MGKRASVGVVVLFWALAAAVVPGAVDALN